jgi:hypothetical protein
MKLNSNELALIQDAMSREIKYQKNHNGGVGHIPHITRLQMLFNRIYLQHYIEFKKGN